MILVNISNLSKGGGIQFAQSVIENFLFLKVDFKVLMRKDQILEINVPKDKYIFLKKKSFLGRLIERNLLDFRKFRVVYSVFGPSYIFVVRRKHFVGFAQGWSINPRSEAYVLLSPLRSLEKRFDAFIKLWLMYFEAEVFLVETNLVAEKLRNYYKNRKIHIVSNTARYKKQFRNQLEFNDFLYVANHYPHKNHTFLFDVAIMNSSKNFYITLADNEIQKLGREMPENVINLGRLDKERLQEVYHKVDVAFIPSLLESFSAAFVEAMTFGLPIIAPHKDFVYDVCGNTAFTYRSLEECNENIRLIGHFWGDRRKEIQDEYVLLLRKYGTPETRARRILKLLEHGE